MKITVRRIAMIFLVALALWVFLYRWVEPSTTPGADETLGIVLLAAVLTLGLEGSWRLLRRRQTTEERNDG